MLRIYVPLACLLCIAPFLVNQMSAGKKLTLATILLALAALINSFFLILHAKDNAYRIQYAQDVVAGFPNHPVFVWGGSLTYELMYPVLANSEKIRTPYFYSLGYTYFDPYSFAHTENTAGRGFLALLLSEKGLELFASEYRIGLLRNYCAEHFKGTLISSNVRSYSDLAGGNLLLGRYRCSTTQEITENNP